VLEAGNLESLLEQFEATETGKSAESIVGASAAEAVLPVKLEPAESQPVETIKPVPVRPMNSDVGSVKPLPEVRVKVEITSPIKATTPVDTSLIITSQIKQEKSIKTKPGRNSRISTLTNSSSQLHRDIRNALPAEVIDRIKVCVFLIQNGYFGRLMEVLCLWELIGQNAECCN